MKREEAIDLLDNLIGMVDDNHDSDYDTALKMAKKALEFIDKIEPMFGDMLDIPKASVKPQEPKTGHWVEENINEWSRKVFCSECGCTSLFEHVSNGDIYSAGGYGVNNKTKFCPNCGARMEEKK